MKAKNRLIFIVGPTGVGKTAFSVKLAERLRGEIISSDSMQAYRYMDIISQKPTRKERRAVAHHLIDILDPAQEYSAAEFAGRAVRLIDEIIKKGKKPIIVGGSGLYIKALIDGLFPAPRKDASFRKKLEEKAERKGSAFLHKELQRVDPEAGRRIHPNDLRRIIRALEIYRLTGRPASENKKNTEGIKKRFKIDIYGLIRERSDLYRRIENRVETMFKRGLVKEVQCLRERGPGITAGASLGYKEVTGFLDKRYSLKDAKELLKKNTRHLAKKQLTWFRADRRIKWLNLGKAVLQEALAFVTRALD